MKKHVKQFAAAIASMAVVLGVASLPLFTSGCDVSEDQLKVIANQSGLFAVLGWIAYDDPDPEVKQSVKGAIEIIDDGLNLVEKGSSYTEVLYPLVERYVNAEVPPHQAPLTLAGATAVLSGVDLLFATYPNVRDNVDVANGIVKQFTSGALKGLSLQDNSPQLRVIKNQNALRNKLSLKTTLNL